MTTGWIAESGQYVLGVEYDTYVLVTEDPAGHELVIRFDTVEHDGRVLTFNVYAAHRREVKAGQLECHDLSRLGEVGEMIAGIMAATSDHRKRPRTLESARELTQEVATL